LTAPFMIYKLFLMGMNSSWDYLTRLHRQNQAFPFTNFGNIYIRFFSQKKEQRKSFPIGMFRHYIDPDFCDQYRKNIFSQTYLHGI